jgi:hypothetical protein
VSGFERARFPALVEPQLWTQKFLNRIRQRRQQRNRGRAGIIKFLGHPALFTTLMRTYRKLRGDYQPLCHASHPIHLRLQDARKSIAQVLEPIQQTANNAALTRPAHCFPTIDKTPTGIYRSFSVHALLLVPLVRVAYRACESGLRRWSPKKGLAELNQLTVSNGAVAWHDEHIGGVRAVNLHVLKRAHERVQGQCKLMLSVLGKEDDKEACLA